MQMLICVQLLPPSDYRNDMLSAPRQVLSSSSAEAELMAHSLLNGWLKSAGICSGAVYKYKPDMHTQMSGFTGR